MRKIGRQQQAAATEISALMIVGRAGRNYRLGRSRGELTTKIHVVVDAQGLPIRLGLPIREASAERSDLSAIGPNTAQRTG